MRALLMFAVTVACVALLIVIVERRVFLTGPLQVAILLGLPAIVAGIALWGLAIKAKNAPEALLLLSSLFVPLYGAEAFLWAGESLQVAEIRAAEEGVAESIRAQGGSYDERSFREYFVDSWRAGTRVYPRIYQLSQRTVNVDSTRVFPTSNLSRRPIVECYQDGVFKVWESDEFGFTNPHGTHGQQAQVVLIGDSFTAGECVSVEEDVGARFRSAGVRTANLGIGGSGPLWQLANLVEYGLPLRPKVVYWLFYEGNDFADLDLESRYPELTRYLTEGSIGARQLKPGIDREVEALQRAEVQALGSSENESQSSTSWISSLRRVAALGRLRMRVGLHRSYAAEESALNERLLQVLARARDISEKQGATLVFVYVPDWTRFAGRADHIDRSAVLDTVTRLRLPIVDVFERFRRLEDPLSVYPHRLPGHFTADGYRKMAGYLVDDYASRVKSGEVAQ